MSARDVLAEAAWLLDREIAGAPLPAPAWVTFKNNDPETAAIYETQAGVYLSALFAAGLVVEQGWQPIETAPGHMGSEVLLFIPPFAPMQGVRRSDGTWMVGARSIIGRLAPGHPTHWRPLPAEPGHG